MAITTFQQLLQELTAKQATHPLLRIIRPEMDSAFYRKQLQKAIDELQTVAPTIAPSTPIPKVAVAKTRPKRKQLPDKLQGAFDRQSELYTIVNHWFPKLELLYLQDKKELERVCLKIKRSWQEINSIYNLLDYYADKGIALDNKYQQSGNCQISLSRDEALRKRNNARSYISKNRNNPIKEKQIQAREQLIQNIELQLEDEGNNTIIIPNS